MKSSDALAHQHTVDVEPDFPLDSNMIDVRRSQSSSLRRKPHTYEFLKKLIQNKRFSEGLDCIANCHKTFGDQPKSMLLTGESGSGKTTLIEHYLNKFPPQETSTGRIIPVLYGVLEERTSAKSITSVLLESCGDPSPYTGTALKLNARLRTYVEKMGIELIIIDELQHVLPEHSGKRMEEAADHLKSLVNKSKIPVVLAGLPSSQKIITLMQQRAGAEFQLERRWRRSFYQSAEEYGSTRWKNLVGLYQKKLGIPCINLTSDEMLKRIYVASHGLHGFISKLLEETLELSDGISQIDKSLLARGYDEATSVRRLTENPFTCSMSLIEDFLVNAIGRHDANRAYWGRLLAGES